MTLTRIKQIPLREKWPNEASDFTPWLAKEGLVLLNETLGMDLILENIEVFVGNYRADIVAKDSLSNEYIVIENQFSSTDHDHIGKLFTYAASFQATTLVWIAEKFRPEHRQAIDWFNENTIKNIDFFGIEIELLQIEDSHYAPNFKIVSKPNEWTREIRADKQNMTEGSLNQLKFWSSFNDFLKENRVPINIRKARAQHWYDVAI